jgi:competence protein ComEC
MEVPAAWVARWSSLEEGAGRNLVAAAGLRVTVEDGLALEVLYPPAAGCPAWAEGDNDCGLVLRLSYGQATFLLTGDAEEPVERSLLIRGALASVWLLKVAHHGSAHGTSEGLLRVALPRLAVISVGDNRYGHPAPDVLERLATSGTDVFRTDQSGTVEIVTDGVTYRVNRAR